MISFFANTAPATLLVKSLSCASAQHRNSYLLLADFERLQVVADDAQLLLELDDLAVILQIKEGEGAKVSDLNDKKRTKVD